MVGGGSDVDVHLVHWAGPALANATAGMAIGSAMKLASRAAIAGATRPASIAGAMLTVAPPCRRPLYPTSPNPDVTQKNRHTSHGAHHRACDGQPTHSQRPT